MPERVTAENTTLKERVRQLSADSRVIGDRDVVYRGGPEAALARARAFIPNVRTQLLSGANHLLTLDSPESLITEVSAALA